MIFLVTEILRVTAAKNHQRNLGKVIKVLVESEKKGCVYGRSSDNTAVKVIGGGPELIGQFVNVMINEARDFGMDGELVIA
ncbi:TRAM domain-containing protein [Candidatus Falkowbacteria bacterium]|nr:TRAM domain-containing protein [Candidatus Falkowbacteria bacterium]